MISAGSETVALTRSSGRGKAWPWFAGVLALLAFDQATKALVRALIPIHESIPVVGRDLVRLTHVQNPGIAFGVTILGLTPLLIFGCGAAVVLAVYLYQLARKRDVLRWPVMLFLAGAAGNSIDRIVFGRVTDFVDVDFPDVIMERFAVFNVADSCITIGITILILLVVFGRHADARRPDVLTAAEGSASPAPTEKAPDDRLPLPSQDPLRDRDVSGPATPED
jgi:signal peptidase II